MECTRLGIKDRIKNTMNTEANKMQPLKATNKMAEDIKSKMGKSWYPIAQDNNIKRGFPSGVHSKSLTRRRRRGGSR